MNDIVYGKVFHQWKPLKGSVTWGQRRPKCGAVAKTRCHFPRGKKRDAACRPSPAPPPPIFFYPRLWREPAHLHAPRLGLPEKCEFAVPSLPWVFPRWLRFLRLPGLVPASALLEDRYDFGPVLRLRPRASGSDASLSRSQPSLWE